MKSTNTSTSIELAGRAGGNGVAAATRLGTDALLKVVTAPRSSGRARSAARRACAPRRSSAVPKLGADHPQLLLERAHDFDHDILRCQAALAEPIHARAHALVRFGQAANELAHDGLILDRSALEVVGLGGARDCVCLSVGPEADRDRPLRDGVGEIAPDVDQLVQLQMERTEGLPDHAPVQLL